MNTNIDITGVVLTTKRLILREWKEDDLDDFYEYASVPGVGEMAGWHFHETRGKTKKILDIFINGKKTFAIVYNNKVIGSLGIEEYNDKAFPEFNELNGREIGYVLSKDYWGKGIMPEAVNAVINYCFNELKLDFLMCGHFTTNNQSWRVQEKCGFKHYKLIKYETRMNEIKDCFMSLLKNEKNMVK